MFCQSAPPASSPAPRLRARSILSLGTEVFFAFWMASYSVGLPAGSRRHLDVLDQLGEVLAPPGVDDRLLVLRGGPLGMAAHAGTTSFTTTCLTTISPINESTWAGLPVPTLDDGRGDRVSRHLLFVPVFLPEQLLGRRQFWEIITVGRG